MMALVAELSMKQALTIELQKEVREKEEFIFSCSSRIEKGLPLNREIEKDWLKVLRDEEIYAFATAEKSRVSLALHAAKCAIVLSSEPIPSWYSGWPLIWKAWEYRWFELSMSFMSYLEEQSPSLSTRLPCFIYSYTCAEGDFDAYFCLFNFDRNGRTFLWNSLFVTSYWSSKSLEHFGSQGLD